MTYYFLSDLHLNPERPATMQMLHSFLAKEGQTATAIYILGDLFDYWLGDDLSCQQFAATIQALNDASKYCKIYFIPGNRDFLVGKNFALQANCTILPDPYIIQLDNNKVLLSHGDLLCTFDKKYQWFRKIIRAKLSQYIYLALPKIWRQTIANKLRSFSTTQNKQKIKYAKHLFAVDTDFIVKWLKQYGADTIIYGHIHTCKLESISHEGLIFKHIVLPDWKTTEAKILCYANNEFGFLQVENNYCF